MDEADFGITLWASDVFATADFLSRVAGLSVEQRHPGYASLRAGDAVITLHDDESYRGHPWYDAIRREGVARGIGAELRFRVPSVTDAYSLALNLRAQSIAAPFEYEGTLECQVLGPDGYVLSLWQPWKSSTPE
jgi:catechol 2,3-dioxygenase-like lactoylglutathione lyase family enzyme